MNNNTPPKYPPRLRSAPKIRDLYWCDFPADAHLPEFWKTRPVVVISRKNRLSGAVTVVPCTTKPQPGNKWAFALITTINGKKGWAICDKPTTVAVSRLSPQKNIIPRLRENEFNDMLKVIFAWLPKLRP